MYLLDTNVISETIKKIPHQNVLDFLSSARLHHFSISVLTLGEIRKGVEKLEDLSKKQKIIRWLEIDLVEQFYGRIVTIDAQIADKWGAISSMKNVPAIDGLIAASAITKQLKLVTRNVKDFDNIEGLDVVNPWQTQR